MKLALRDWLRTKKFVANNAIKDSWLLRELQSDRKFILEMRIVYGVRILSTYTRRT